MNKLTEFYEKPFPRLKINDHYYLREQSTRDARTFFKYYSDPEVGKYILARKPRSLTDAEKEIQHCRDLFYDRRGVYWAIADQNHHQMLGAVGLLITSNHRRAELFYDLARSHWKKGIMSDALRTILDFAFDNLDLCRIEAFTTKTNIASIRTLEKMGFQFEATLKNYRIYADKAHDVDIYSLIKLATN